MSTDRRLTMAQAIAEAIGQEMERDSKVFVMGEDIGRYGGIFSATGGLLDRFGPERIMDTPISETGFIGAATGAAAESNAYDAKGLMTQAIRDDSPVMFFMHKGLMGLPWMQYYEGATTVVPAEPYTLAFGQAAVVREGRDLTIVAVSQMVQKAQLAAQALQAQDIHAEVIDLRTLVPLDTEAVIRSVAKTGRLLVADEDYLNFGLTGEIAALVAERLDSVALKAPVRRLGVPGVPIPYSRPLEQAVIPSVQRIVEASRKLVDTRLKAAEWPISA
jgi:pyruvate/2-oxoglutarate/acetoin dehydrogenase E1 component